MSIHQSRYFNDGNELRLEDIVPMAWMYRPQCLNADNELQQSHIRNADARRWATSTRGSKEYLSNYANAQGAASLQTMAWRSVMINMTWLDAETLRIVPWAIGRRLWRKLQENDLVSVLIWQTFVSAYRDELDSDKLRDMMLHTNSPRIMTYDPQGRGTDIVFTSYIEQITAPSFEWINLLTLVDANLPRQDWIHLAKLPNLGALCVRNSRLNTVIGSPDNVVMRAWSRAAQETGALSALKVVLLCNQPNLTLGTLDDLQNIPTLKILHLTGPHLRSHGILNLMKHSRWLWMDRSSLCLKLYAAWHARQGVASRLKDMYSIVVRTDMPDKHTQDKPLLNVMCGPDPISCGLIGTDQLWFELGPKNTRDEIKQKEKEAMVQQRSDTQPSQKRLKVRQSAHQSMADLMGDML